MSRWSGVALATALLVGAAMPARAQAPVCETVEFAGHVPAETAWSICFRVVSGGVYEQPNGLRMGPVAFRPGPGKPFVKVAHELQVGEIFVPYAGGSPRYLDLSFFGFEITSLTEADCPAAVGGSRPVPTVCRERRDRGLAWRQEDQSRRGAEIVYWGALSADNYQYVMEYAFRDDGVIVGRLGATGQNLPGAEAEAHTHGAFWRIDMDLGGAVPNMARVIAKTEPCTTVNPPDPNRACEVATGIATASSQVWNSSQHTMLEVSNPSVKNARGRPIAYRLMPLALSGGMGRHKEAWTVPDFWVTRYQQNALVGRTPTLLPTYVAGAPSLAGQDVVLWVKGTAFHHPRTEDGVVSGNFYQGTTHLMWSGFLLHPHDLFDCTPLYQGCPANATLAPAMLHAPPARVVTPARPPVR